MARGPALKVEIDRLDLGGRRLFEGFRLDVPPGQVVALVGPSGVGKTTLLRILAGIEQCHEGRVTIDGLPAAEAPVPGFVFQDARLLPWLDAAGNIRAVAPATTDARLAELLTAVRLEGHQQSFPHQLSGGMQRRLGLARALSVNPRLLLLDEPFVSLDRVVVDELVALFQGVIARAGPTTVLVSHDPEDAARLADRAVLIAGRPVRIVADLPLAPAPLRRSPHDVLALAQSIRRAGTEVPA